jgi:hypothetical protein
MSTVTIFTLLVVGGLVWGGFIFFLVSAIKFENNKRNYEQEQTSSSVDL